jgi:hypothetical protein
MNESNNKPRQGRGVEDGVLPGAGDVIVIQDADLEYDPADWAGMWELIAERGWRTWSTARASSAGRIAR